MKVSVLGAAAFSSLSCASATRSAAGMNGGSFNLRGGDSMMHRRLNNERDDCPEDSRRHCSNPARIMNDDSVRCDWDTCLWILDRLDPERMPSLCEYIEIIDYNNIPDFLEPCYWWEVFFGALAPSASPSNSLSPTTTYNPSHTPSFAPSETSGPSLVPSSAPSDLPTVSQAPSVSPSSVPSGSPSAPTLMPSSDLALNGTFGDVTFHNETTPVNTHAVDFDTVLLTLVLPDPSARRRILSTMDRSELLSLTTQYLLEELEGDNVESVQLAITPVQTKSVAEENGDVDLVAVTEAIDGTVVFELDENTPADTLTPSSVQQMVEGSFQAEGMDRYVSVLSTAEDPGLQAVEQVHVGLPSDVVDDSNSPDQVDTSTTDGGNEFQFEWNAFWISIIAGGGAIVLGIVAVILCFVRRCIRRRRERATDALSIKATITQNSSGDVASPTLRDDTVDPTSSSGNAGDRIYSNEDGVDSVMDEDDRSQRYAPSDVTSVYSYIEANTTMDDQSYSIAPSLMYGSSIPGEDDDQSKMWSVADGIPAFDHADANSLSDYEVFTTPVGLTGKEAQSQEKDDEETGRVLKFGEDGEEDDVSSASDEAKKRKEAITILGAVEQKKTAMQSVIDSPYEKMGDDRESEEDDEEESVDPVPEKKRSQSALSQAMAKVGNKMTKSLAYAKMGANYSEDEDNSSMEGHEKKRSSSLSQAMSRVGSKFGMSARNKENSGNRKFIQPSASMESSDDDSSLFMGPGLGRYPGKEDRGSILTLSENDKMDITTGDPFRPASSDKRQLGLLGTGSGSISEDEDSFSMPQPYRSDADAKEDAPPLESTEEG